MPKEWIKMPQKQSFCSVCKIPSISSAEKNKFLAELKKHGFNKKGVSDVNGLLTNSTVDNISGRGFGKKTRRLCALAICSSIVLVAIGGSRSAIHEILIASGYLPQLCSSNVLVRLGHDYLVREFGGLGVGTLTCEQKALAWRASVDGILGLVAAAGINIGGIKSNFNKSVAAVEDLIDEWMGDSSAKKSSTRKKSSGRKSSSKKSSSKKSSPQLQPGAAAAKKTHKSPRGRSKGATKKRSRSRSRSGSKSPRAAVGPSFSEALIKANVAADKYAPPPPDYEKMGQMAKYFELPKKQKKKTRKKSGAAMLPKKKSSSEDGYSPEDSSTEQ